MPIALTSMVTICLWWMADEMNSWGRQWIEKDNIHNAETCFNTALMFNASAFVMSLIAAWLIIRKFLIS